MTPSSSAQSLLWPGLTKSVSRVASLAPGVLIVALALLAPSLRRSDGWLEPQAWTLAVAGMSLTLLAATWRTPWQRCGGLLSLALFGQACALGLKDSPPYNVLEHYFPWQDIWTSPKRLLVVGALAQTLLVAAIVWRQRRSVAAWTTRVLTLPQALVLVAMTIFAAANGSWDVWRYLAEVGLAIWIFSINLGNLALVAAAVPAHFLERSATRLRQQFGRAAARGASALVPWAVAAGVTAVCATLSWVVFERIPHIPDDISYLFQAKYFAAGHLYLPAPPDAASFSVGQTVNDGVKWYGYGSPAWPAVLAVGVLAGVPWLVNPLLCGLTIIMVHALLRRLYDRRVADASILLLAVSPWFLFMGASFLTHPLSVVLMVGSLLAITRSRETGYASWAAAGGAALGALVLTRPLAGMLLAVPIGLWVLAERLAWRSLLAFGGAGALVGLLVLPYNRALTGSPTYFPIAKYTDEAWYPGANRLGFGPDIGNVGWPHLDPLPGHGPLDVVVNANQNVYMTNFDLFGWTFGSLGFVGLIVVWRRWTRADRLMLGIIAAVVVGHSFYWFSGGPDIGARYWYETLVPLVVLTVRGVQELQQRWSVGGTAGLAGYRVTAFVVAASVVALVNVVPWRSLGKYHRYRGVRADMARLADRYEFGRALVFVREGSKNDYASAFVFNPPTLTEDAPVFARATTPEQQSRVQRAYPDRPVWVVAGGATADQPFTVVAGPLPALGAGGDARLPDARRESRGSS